MIMGVTTQNPGAIGIIRENEDSFEYSKDNGATWNRVSGGAHL